MEARAVIENIEKTRQSVELLGGQFRNHYILKDTIYIPRNGQYDLSHDSIRIRENIKTNWPVKKYILTRKQTQSSGTGKIDNVIMKKEFDTEEEASTYMDQNMPDFMKGFEYEKEGWQYQLDKNRIFIEDIKGWKPSIEIEAGTEKEIDDLLARIGIIETVHSSVPEIMRSVLNVR